MMWKWIKFSFRVWLAFWTADLIVFGGLALLIVVIILVTGLR